MDRSSPQRPPQGQRAFDSQPAMTATYPAAAFQPTSAAPLSFTFADPFQSNKDPFLTRALDRQDGFGQAARAWPGTTGRNMPNGHAPQDRPLPPTNGTAQMPLPYDPSRRGSLGASGSPPQPAQAPLDSLPHPSPFQLRRMPPPSPPQLPTNGSSLPGSAPLGPPTASPFTGARDLASYSSGRPPGGMSILSMLGGNSEEKRSHGSPPSSAPKPMLPPSPGRARSSSMREGLTKALGDGASTRTVITEQPRPASAIFGHDRTSSEPRREGLFASPRFRDESVNQFRAFQPPEPDARSESNGRELSRRPGSQPAGLTQARGDRDLPGHRDPLSEGRYGAFRPFGDPPAAPQQSSTARQEGQPHQNGQRPASTHAEQGRYSSPRAQQEYPPPGVLRFQAGTFGTPLREEQAGLFRPAYQPTPEGPRETIESRSFPDIRRDVPRSSPPVSDLPPYDRNRNTFGDRPMTFEEHHRAETLPREPQRKESDPYVHRAVFNISPEMNRKGRNSPLPQAVQGAQHRHVGPGGDNPGVKMEFGRMFPGLGSGVGTATPTGGHANGIATPTRMTPIRQVESGDLVRTAVAEIEGRRSAKIDGRKKNGRRTRDEEERMNGRDTPDHERGLKRSKTSHAAHHHHVHPHLHHHHHHHHQPADNTTSNAFTPIRFQPNQPPQPSTLASAPTHHHHHHHGAAHAHPVHHHHHVPRPSLPPPPPPRKPITTVTSKKLLEACAKKPRKHLGSQLYALDFSMPQSEYIHTDSKIKFSAKSQPIPLFEGKDNCTYTVRVPRQYVAISGNSDNPSYLEEICRHRQLWGTEVYTDDSDVIAAAVHSGWLKGDFGDANDDLREVCGNDSEHEDAKEEIPLTLTTRPRKPVRAPNGRDAHITLLLLPPLERYASTTQHHIWSREWDHLHDGMSFMIERIDFVDETPATRTSARGAKARKARIAAEEAARRQDAAAGLLMFSQTVGPGPGAPAIAVP